MSVRLNGSTSGYTELDAPPVAGNNTLKLPAGNGSADQVLGGNGAGQMSWVDRSRMVLETAKPSSSGTSIDFPNIPSWVKRVTVMLSNVSLSGSSDVLVQLGAGSVTSTGYVSASATTSNVGRGANNGFLVIAGTATFGIYGHVCLTNVSGNSWLSSHQGFLAGSSTLSFAGGGVVNLSGTLDRIRITTVNGTDTFDAGSVNLLLEG